MRVAIIGSGPIGIEAALALIDRGHHVTVYEAGDAPAASVARWAHLTLFTPWPMLTTARGRARLGDPAWLSSEDCPAADFRGRYLLPLCEGLGLRMGHRLVQASRSRLGKGEALASPARGTPPFRLLFATPDGEEVDEAELLLDCSGTLSDPGGIGPGGVRVPGEAAAAASGRLRYGPLPVDDLAGKRVLVVGDGASGTQVVLDLKAQGADVLWFTATLAVPGFPSPQDDPLPVRRTLWLAGRRVAGEVDHRPGAQVSRLDSGPQGLRVQLEDGVSLLVDAAIACTGFRPDLSPLRELQFHACYASEGPMKLAAALLGSRASGADCLQEDTGLGADTLRSPEPGLFLLGSKSYGRRNDFLLQNGHRQIEQLLELLQV